MIKKYISGSFLWGMAGVFLLSVIVFSSFEMESTMAVDQGFSKNSQNRAAGSSINQRFASLQDYLDWAQNSRIADIPYYHKIAENQYQITPSRGLPWDKTIYSYEALRKKLGFEH